MSGYRMPRGVLFGIGVVFAAAGFVAFSTFWLRIYGYVLFTCLPL